MINKEEMMKRIIFGLIIITAFLAGADMSTYCTAPPFVGGHNAVVIPNVLICQDFTGSMRFWVYDSWPGYSHSIDPYNPNKVYYGYADPNSNYEIVWFNSRQYYRKNPNGSYSGNEINWWHTTRIDVARKVLTGGKGPAYNDKSRLLFEEPYYRVNSSSGSYVYGIITTDSTEISKGVVREIADVDDDYVWDEGAPHFALQTFSTRSPFYRRVKCPFGSSLRAFLDTLEQKRPTGGTWCGDAIFEGIHYYRFTHPHWRNNTWSYTWSINDVGTELDPWYEVVGGDTVSVSCRPSFFIFVSDGESNSDNPVSDCSHLPHPASPYGPSYYGFRYYNGPDSSDGTHGCADDYAYYAHVTDLRPDADPIYGIPDKQTLTFYSIFLFATPSGATLSKNIAIFGGFKDSDTLGDPGYLKPDKQFEYDADSNGVPDNYYYADEGYALEQAFRNIFVNIQELARVTSASGGAISGSGIKGGGVVYNATFYPTLDLTSTLSLNWIGKAAALWLDPYGNLREETQGNRILHLKNDLAIEMFFSAGNNQTMVARFQDTSGLGTLVPLDTVPVESLNFLWDAGEHLLTRNPDNRRIFYNRNGNRRAFVINQNWLDARLDFGNGAACDSLIQYIRGVDYPNWRSREYNNNNIWKLGDIIHSSPMPVGAPSEAYHMVYGDDTYYSFWEKYLDRRTVVYAGGNDGMIHAFNAGLYETLEDPITIARVQTLGQALGKELWAFIPYNVLPHLKWLADTNYCHVYYVDLKPYPTDVKIFTPDSTWHPYGWGTILVTGMRFGGGEIDVTGVDTFRSAYCCFDVTDPERDNRRPQFMWEFTDDNLGFTMCVPAVIKIKDMSGTNDKWYLVFGSGPQSKYGDCNQPAHLYVLDIATGTLIHEFTIPDSNTAITNIFSADFGLNYYTNLAYFGTYDNSGGGTIYRLMTHNDPDPVNWTLHKVITLNKPITAEGSVATDSKGNLWIYFGTGKYFSNIDVANTDTMMFVGVKDDTTQGDLANPAFTLNDLANVTDVHVYSDTVISSLGVNNFDELVQYVEARDGWYRYFDSIPGERVITSPLVLGGAVIFTSFIPQDTTGASQGPDLCIGGGGGPQAGNLWALFYTTGTAYKTAMLDTNATGEFKTYIPIIGDMPSEPAMHISADQEKVFVQSAGGLIGIETPLPYNPRGGVMLWRGR